MTPKSKRRYIGYARVSTLDQDPEHQIKALKAAGCERIFTDQASGAVRARPELTKALNCVVGGDTLIVWEIRPAGTVAATPDRNRDLPRRAPGATPVSDPGD